MRTSMCDGRRRLRLPVAVAAIGLAALGAAGARAEVSQSDKDACTPDVWRLCAGQVPFVDQIVACLNRKMNRLSPACRSVMQGGDHSARNRRRRD